MLKQVEKVVVEIVVDLEPDKIHQLIVAVVAVVVVINNHLIIMVELVEQVHIQ